MRRYPVTFLLAQATPGDPTTAGQANGSSTAEVVAFCVDGNVQIDGTFVADVAIEGRVNESATFQPLTTVSGPTIYPVYGSMQALQITVSNYVSGTVTAYYGGINQQQG